LVSESTIEDSSRPLRIVVAGGGTGGHVSPAVAVIQELRQRVKLDGMWIGLRPEFEGKAAKELGLEFRTVQAGKLRRYASLETIGDAFRVPYGMVQAWRILRGYRPDIILSTGGFVSVPTVVAGSRLGIPSITHEQTAHIGLATRINARFCDVIALSYDRSISAIGKTSGRVVVTGNPVRRFVQEGNPARALARFNLAGDLPLVYVTGGSQGSRAINSTIRALLPDLLSRAEVIHQCGPRSLHDDYDRLTREAETLPPDMRDRYRICEQVGSELGDIYAAASLVIGRAGAGTVAELATLGIPSILVPLPGAEEQRQNALHLVEAGAAVSLEQSTLTPERLMGHICRLLSNTDTLLRMRRSASEATVDGAAARLAQEVLELAARSAGHVRREPD
jgi:UDP-N-acetylglucosamine--N-acetylmuramyl-(pentapeptide) pyrophosphoryl-undecaprenol N-acetylglucosamine transferase